MIMAMANDSLKQQFQLLQEQQQKKLERRKQRKKEKEKSTVSTLSAHSAFGIEDDLDLKAREVGPGTDSYLSEELVQHLNDQIRELKDENGRLYKLLSEKDFEVRSIKKKIEKQEAVRGASGAMNVTNETAASKIVELSKKVREMTSELESEKTKCKQYANKCQSLQTQLSLIPPEAMTMMSSNSNFKQQLTEKQDDPSEVKVLQERLKQSEFKQTDFRNQCQSLKQELKLAHRVLSQEVGEGVSVQSLLSGNSSWKGRAEQVQMLQKKVTELKSQLEIQKVDETTDYDLEDEMMGRTSGRRRTAEARSRENLRKVEKERKEAQEKTLAELKALEEDFNSLKQKNESAKARNKVLSTELKAVKQQMQTLVQKGQHDDELIDALMKQQTQVKQMLDTTTKQQEESNKQQTQHIKEMSLKQQQDNNLVEQMKGIVAEKENRIHILEQEINQMKINQSQRPPLPVANSWFSDNASNKPPLSSRPQSGMSALSSRQNTFGEIEVTATISPPQSRLSERPPSANNLVLESARSASRKSTRPPSASQQVDKQLLAELQYQCQEYRTLQQAAEVERDKLMELTQILQQRLDEGTLTVTDLQNELGLQKKKAVVLEKQIGKAKLDMQNNKNSATKKKPSKSNVSSSRVTMDVEDEETNNNNLDEVAINLEIQKDENEALKTALNSTLKAKQEDLKIYNDMMEETKKVFLQALRQFKQGNNT